LTDLGEGARLAVLCPPSLARRRGWWHIASGGARQGGGRRGIAWVYYLLEGERGVILARDRA